MPPKQGQSTTFPIPKPSGPSGSLRATGAEVAQAISEFERARRRVRSGSAVGQALAPGQRALVEAAPAIRGAESAARRILADRGLAR